VLQLCEPTEQFKTTQTTFCEHGVFTFCIKDRKAMVTAISLAGFQETMAELGVADQVTTFASSEFGLTLTVNGDGSDHGWSGHYMVSPFPIGSTCKTCML